MEILRCSALAGDFNRYIVSLIPPHTFFDVKLVLDKAFDVIFLPIEISRFKK
jgi:hypothetical protein